VNIFRAYIFKTAENPNAMTRITITLFLLLTYIKSNAQIDSSKIFESRISGGGSKSWFPGPPVIIDVPRNTPQKSFTFKLRPKSAEWILPKLRDISVVRKFATWSIKKQPSGRYVLMLPRGDNYFISFSRANDNSLILFLTRTPESPPITNVGGIYFEKKFQINP
jgi:hypothetical protein